MANFFISIYVSNYLKNRRYNDAKIKTIPTLKAKRRRKWFLKKKISESMMGKNLGKKRTEEEKAKLKNRIPWNKGLKGVTVPWNKGLKGAYSQSEEANRKRSATMKGRPKVIGSGRKKKVNS